MKLLTAVFVAITVCMATANHQQALELDRAKQQAETYKAAYERVCRQTRVPVQSNFDQAMAKPGKPGKGN